MRYGAVTIKNGKAYVSTVAIAEAGYAVLTEPIFVTEMRSNELAVALQQALDQGHSRVPNVESGYPRNHPLLRKAGVKSWREFERDSLAFAIDWGEESIAVGIGDKSTKFWWDPAKYRLFPPDTSPQIIADEIVRYWETHADPAVQKRSVVWVHNRRAFLPMPAKTEAGFFVDVDPILQKALTADHLNQGVQEVLAATPKPVTKAHFERWMGRGEEKDLLLREAGVKTYQQLRRESIVFTLVWRTDSTRVYVTKPSHETSVGWRGTYEFPPDAPVKELVDRVLQCLALAPCNG